MIQGLQADREKVITVSGLSKSFNGFYAVSSISFEVYQGEVFGFLGANGAGKTTVMKMLCGLLKPGPGKANVAGFDIATQAAAMKFNIGYMSQHFSLYQDLTIVENIRYFSGIYGIRRKQIRLLTARLLAELNLEHMAHKQVNALPAGWKQKLAFAVALLHQPRIVFLDEPTAGVDPLTRRQFWDMIYRASASGTTVFITTHYMDEAEYCDRVSMMVDGEIKAIGTPAALKLQYGSPTMDDVFYELARGAKRKE